MIKSSNIAYLERMLIYNSVSLKRSGSRIGPSLNCNLASSDIRESEREANINLDYSMTRSESYHVPSLLHDSGAGGCLLLITLTSID